MTKCIVYPAKILAIMLFIFFVYMRFESLLLQIFIALLFFALLALAMHKPAKRLKEFKAQNRLRIYKDVVRAYPFNQAELDELGE